MKIVVKFRQHTSGCVTDLLCTGWLDFTLTELALNGRVFFTVFMCSWTLN